MWINFINLNGGDIEDYLNEKEERESCSMLIQPQNVFLRMAAFGKHSGWVVQCSALYGPDPKIHFTDEAKARLMYEQLTQYISGASHGDCFHVNALEYGAI